MKDFKNYAVIGQPIKHSMSPAMHNYAFEYLNLPSSYQLFEVTPLQLEEAVNGLKALGFGGFNVTIPHKENVMNYLDEIDEEAKAIGAVNTVVIENDKLIGYNTDGRGFVKSLFTEAGDDALSKRILLIGAGGAARAIYMTMARMGAVTVDIANRTIERANSIITDCRESIDSESLTIKEAEEKLSSYDIVVNTTPIGMNPNNRNIPLSLNNLVEGTLLCDIIYNPLETKWLYEGRLKGASTMNGIGMFVYQGALAFELWTGHAPNERGMEDIVYKQLGGKSNVNR
jgi:shikimate dehydrogenase